MTDHKNLQTFATTKQLSPRHMRWSEFLSRFNFRIVYKPGVTNTRPDALSRRPGEVPQSEEDQRLQYRRRALIAKDKFDPEMLKAVQLYALDTSKPIEDLITASHERSKILQQMISALCDPDTRQWPRLVKKVMRIPFAECVVTGYRDRLVLDPDDDELHVQIIQRTHASRQTGHPGRTKSRYGSLPSGRQ